MKPHFTIFEIGLLLAIGTVGLSMVLPILPGHRHGVGNESNAIGSLRSITSAQAIYLERTSSYGSLQQLEGAGLIDALLASGAKSGYLFALTTRQSPPGNLSFTVSATPATKHSGTRCFFVDETGIIRFSSAPISKNSQGQPIGGNK